MIDVSIQVERTFNNPVSDVWHALTEYEEVKKWFFDIPDFQLEQGKVFSFIEPNDVYKRLHTCKILEIKDESLLKYTWIHPNHSIKESIVTWILIPRGNATLVRLTHEGINWGDNKWTNFTKDSYEAGWSEILGTSLNNFLLNKS